MTDKEYMQIALEEARKAQEKGEIPIGGILVCDGVVVATAHNERETRENPLAHAEILLIQRGAERLSRRRLTGCTLYVTIEPCPMCAGAIMNARISRLVYGASNSRDGGIYSAFSIGAPGVLNHHLMISSGICEQSCKELLVSFFCTQRNNF